MAESKPSDEQAAGQHYLVCGIKDCQQNCQYYCNVCHHMMCEQCRNKHSKDPDTKTHEVVFYRQRRRQLPEEKCKFHPRKNLDILCKECDIPVCSKCSTMQEHHGHHYEDLEDIYAENFAFCQNEVSKIQQYFLPTSNEIKEDIKEDAVKIKSVMESIRRSMTAEAESVKELVDEVTSENIEQTRSMEKPLLKMLESQETTYSEYITSLEKLLKKMCMEMATETFRFCSSAIVEQFKIPNIPETTEPGLPVFSISQCSKNDIVKLLGKIELSDTEKVKRKIKPIPITSTQLQYTGKHEKQEDKKPGVKQTLSLSSSVTKVKEYSVLAVNSVYHVSVDKSDRLWVSDSIGKLVQTDLHGNLLQKIQTSGTDQGYHTATQSGNLIYTDQKMKVIYKITQDQRITEFIKTGDWEPLSVYSSRINGDILVGMYKLNGTKIKKSKVTRYSKTGKEIQNIQRDKKDQKLYGYARYITENINGDICTSDNRAVVVMNKSGQHRFSYTGQGSGFYSWGICTDVLGHILVCVASIMRESIHMLDQNGGFLCVILSQQQGVACPLGVCVDDENNLYVGQFNTNTVTVYKYLK